MKQIKLNKDTWDWEFTEGRLTFITSTERAAQSNRQALQTFLKEYFLDTSFGVPYFEYIFVKAPDYARISAELRKAITRDEEVDAVTSLTIELEKNTRFASIAYTATTIKGNQVEDIVEVNLNE